MRELTRPPLAGLAAERWDLVVIGGGSHGAFAAWEAARRGLRTLLVERHDWCGGTSANSLKVVHGGLRYLQSLDVARVRASARERRVLAGLAPHLVGTLPCVLPARGLGTRSPLALRAAVLAAAMITGGVRDDAERDRVVSSAEYRRLAGALALPAAGALLWHDGILHSPERLVLAVLHAAVAAGAVVRNYTAVTGLLRTRDGVAGVRVRDHDGHDAEIPARAVLDATGPWAGALLAGAPAAHPVTPLVLGWNVVLRREAPAVAAALPLPREGRMLFAVPWRGHLMLGTGYRRVSDEPSPCARVEEADIEAILADANAALPALRLRREEVVLAHAGLLPADEGARTPTPAARPVLTDVGADDPTFARVVVMQGVKWTTARRVAERAVDLVEQRLGRPVRHPPLAPLLPPPATGEAEGTLALYGALADDVRALAAADPALAAPLAPGSVVLGAQVVHAVRAEQARRLEDVVLRRTELGTTGRPAPEELAAAAAFMARELGWSAERVAAERAALDARYRDLGARPA